MPNYVGYSPWMDAAQVGRGIGQSLSAALFQVPAMRRKQAQDDREYELQRRRVQAEEDLIPARSDYYRAQAQGIPDRIAASNDANRIRETLGTARQLLDETRANIAQQNADSQGAYRTRQEQHMDTVDALYPELQNKRLDLMDSNIDRNDTYNSIYPAQIGLGVARFNADPLTRVEDRLPMPNVPVPMARPRRTTPQAPKSSGKEPLVPHISNTHNTEVNSALSDPGFNETLQKALLFLGGQKGQPPTVSTDSPMATGQKFSPHTPPNDTHQYRVRNKKTGEIGWADEQGLQDPEWERVQ